MRDDSIAGPSIALNDLREACSAIPVSDNGDRTQIEPLRPEMSDQDLNAALPQVQEQHAERKKDQKEAAADQLELK
jgi:hypothetical protein